MSSSTQEFAAAIAGFPVILEHRKDKSSGEVIVSTDAVVPEGGRECELANKTENGASKVAPEKQADGLDESADQ